MAVTVKVNKNGSFDINTAELELKGCFPGIDGHSIMPLKVQLTNNKSSYELKYELEKGIITLKIEHRNCEVKIYTKLSGFDSMPHWFFPIFEGSLKQAEGLYRQGFGFCGPSGYVDISDFESKNDKIESYGLIALKGSKNFLFMKTDSHKRFIQRYQVHTDTCDSEVKRISGGFCLECIPENEIELPVFHIYSNDLLSVGLKEAALSISETMDARMVQEPAFHWCSWYYMYYNFSQWDLKEYVESFSALSPQFPLKYIQIDAGYFPSCGDWLETNSRWPDGMKNAFDTIKHHGYKPAIWIGPFMVGNRSKLYEQHPDWILLYNDGKPVTPWKFYGEERVWGYKDEEYYVLDTSHPDAMEYIRKVFRTLKGWGAELFKTDFMLWGIQDSTKVKRYIPGKTSVEYFRDFLEAVREEIGQDAYWLGCIAPFLPFIGYADGMRIAGDVGAQWNGKGFGPENMIQEVVGDNYFNNIYWQNDPDAILLRNFYTHLEDKEIESLALFQAISGGAVYTSDPLHQISEEGLKMLSFIKPSERRTPFIPYLDQKRGELVFVHELGKEGRYLMFFFNPTEQDITEQYCIEELTGQEKIYLRLFNTQVYSDEMKKDILVRIPSHGCRLYFGSTEEVLDWEIKNLWEWN
jgi:alpha-galactosidase